MAMSLCLPKPLPKVPNTAEEVLSVLPNVNEYFVVEGLGAGVFEQPPNSVAVPNNDEGLGGSYFKKTLVSPY
jgi:hypothetical protein